MNAELILPVRLSGSCLCGGVRYRIGGPVRGVVNCFCSQCRKTSGHYVAATRVNLEHLELQKSETLEWYESSSGVQRGFCRRCGGSLFWSGGENNEWSIMAGTLDAPTGLQTVASIHEQDASDYHAIPDV